MESFFDFTITPFYYIGMAVWKIMLILIGVTAGETPQAFSEGTWNYITQSLYPLFLAIGSTLLNVFFLIGYLRSVSNLRDGMTLEMFIELCIKVALGNLVIQSIIPIMEQIFNLAGGISKLLIAGTDNPFVQSDMDGGAIFFYAVFGIIYFAVCLVSSVTIFLARQLMSVEQTHSDRFEEIEDRMEEIKSILPHDYLEAEDRVAAINQELKRIKKENGVIDHLLGTETAELRPDIILKK